MTPKLSILVCSIYKRRDNFLKELLAQFDKQLGKCKITEDKQKRYTLFTRQYKNVEVIICPDRGFKRGGMSVGDKRNFLVSLMKGRYGAFIDDDDEIYKEYFHYLLSAIDQSDVDVINFFVLFNSLRKKKIVEYGLRLPDSEKKDRFLRTSNHLMCIRREVLQQIRFPSQNMGEDAIFARNLRRVAQSEVLIEQVLYYYNFSHMTSETQ